MESNKQNLNDPNDLIDFENADVFDPAHNPEGEDVTSTDLKLGKQESSASRKQEEVSEEDRDARSVFVKNVHYSATKTEIEEHFNDCGEIKLITIISNKLTHQPQG